MALAEVEDGEERLLRIGAVSPMSGPGTFVPPITADVVVLLGIVAGVIARVAHQVWVHLHEGRRLANITTMMVGAQCRRVHPGDNAAARC